MTVSGGDDHHGEHHPELSMIETVPDDVFSHIVSHLDAASLLALEASRTLRTRVSLLSLCSIT